MAKTIRKTIQITTRKRNNGVKINEEFYSYDKNNAQFEFIMDYDVPADKVIALFHFEQTNRYYETLCQFKGNLITIDFDTSLIVEDELVTGYLYFDKLEKSTDVYRFTFGARVSEIDKTRELPVQEKGSKRIVPVADIVTKQELQALMDKIRQNGGTYDDSELRGRVTALENKTDNDTRYDDSELRQAIGAKADKEALLQFSTKSELTPINDKVQSLENNIGRMATQQQLEELVSKNELENKGYLTSADTRNFALKSEIPVVPPQPDLSHLATKKEIEDSHYLTREDITGLATNSKVEAVENRVTALENKPTIDTSEFARKSEIPQPYNDNALTERVSLLEAKAIANGAYDDKPLLDKIHAIEEKSNAAITAHQSLEHLVTRDELDEKHYLTSVPEEYAKKSDLYNDSELRNKIVTLETNSVTKEELAGKNYIQDVSNLATNVKVEAVESRVLALENKPTVDTSQFVSKEELESKGYIHDVSGLATKQELEAAKASIPQPYNDTEIRGQLAHKVDTDTLATLATKQELQTNDEEVKRRLTTLEGKTDNFITGVSVNKEGSNVTLTYNYVDGQSKNVSFTDSDTVNVAYDDSDLRNRVVALETKEDKDTKYDDTEVKRRLTELESKPTVDTSVFVTEEKLNSKGYITDISRLATKEELVNVVTNDELEAKHYVTEEQLNNKSYLTQQNLDNYALKSELPQPYNDGPLNERVTALENKPTTGGTVDTSNFVTKEELPDYVPFSLCETYSTDTLKETLEKNNNLLFTPRNVAKDAGKIFVKASTYIPEVFKGDINNAKTVNLDVVMYSIANSLPDGYSLADVENDINNKVTFLSNKNFSEVVPKEELKTVIKELGVTGSNIDTSSFVTKQELEDKHYLNDISNLATKVELQDKVNKSDFDTLKNDVVKHDELSGLHYLTETTAAETYAKKSELPTPYNDSALASRVSALESKQDNDTVYNDTEIKQRLTNLENRPQVESYNDSGIKQRLTALETNHVTKEALNESLDRYGSQIVTKEELADKHYLTTQQADSVYAKKTEILNMSQFATTDSVNNILRTQGEQATKISALENKSAYEIHGTGMPNGKVSAPIGTTYVDTAVTNGALKWIKQSGTGNTGWKVLIGDTGWRTLNSVSRAGNSFIKIRRVNNLVTYQFGGLQWGWFGVGRRNGPGYMGHGSSGNRGAKVVPVGGIPEGFRSESSLVGPTFNDGGRPYGVWYLGGKSDSNYIQFTFNEEIPTNKDIGDIRVSAVSYITDEEWPTTLP